jgi:hypothetical protein
VTEYRGVARGDRDPHHRAPGGSRQPHARPAPG